MTELKACPVWATSMVLNYRAMYKSQFKKDSLLTNDEIFTIIESIHDDTDRHNEEKERVLEMEKWELGHD